MVNETVSFDFRTLFETIRKTHEYVAPQAERAVNISLTMRNWVIGCCIRGFEQKGSDWARYGDNVLEFLSKELKASLDRCYSARDLRLCRQLYATYPQIRKSVISGLPTLPETTDSTRDQTGSPQWGIPADRLVGSLSFTHFVELIKLDDDLKRAFYEIECIRGNWSVRELRRQINSLYYERSGLSDDRKKLTKLAHKGTKTTKVRPI